MVGGPLPATVNTTVCPPNVPAGALTRLNCVATLRDWPTRFPPEIVSGASAVCAGLTDVVVVATVGDGLPSWSVKKSEGFSNDAVTSNTPTVAKATFTVATPNEFVVALTGGMTPAKEKDTLWPGRPAPDDTDVKVALKEVGAPAMPSVVASVRDVRSVITTSAEVDAGLKVAGVPA